MNKDYWKSICTTSLETSRFGPWQRRPWELWPQADGRPRVEVVLAAKVPCLVSLVEGALDQNSLAALSQLGVDVGSTPHRDHPLLGY